MAIGSSRSLCYQLRLIIKISLIFSGVNLYEAFSELVDIRNRNYDRLVSLTGHCHYRIFFCFASGCGAGGNQCCYPADSDFVNFADQYFNPGIVHACDQCADDYVGVSDSACIWRAEFLVGNGVCPGFIGSEWGFVAVLRAGYAAIEVGDLDVAFR